MAEKNTDRQRNWSFPSLFSFLWSPSKHPYSMALPNSPDWSLACGINSCNKRIHKPTFFDACKTVPIVSILCLNSRANFTTAKSSSCSSPAVLVDASPTTNSSSSVIEVNLKPQDLQPSTIPGTEDLNGVICTLFKDPQMEELAYEYYEKAKEKPDFVPQKATLRLLVRYLQCSKNWNSLLKLAEDLKVSRVLPDGSTCCRLIGSCVRARKFKLVNSLLELVLVDKELAVLAFDSAMRGYNKLHMYSSTIALYDKMKSAGVELDPGCCCHIMEAYLKMRNYEKVIMLFQVFEEKKFDITSFSTKIYWVLCEALGKLGRSFEALEYFREMVKKDIPEDHLFYSSLICSFASIQEVEMAEELLAEAENKKMLRDPALFLKLVLMYIHEGLMEKTLDVVAVMNRVKIRVSDCIFCAIVNAFSKTRGSIAAVKVYEDLILQDCEPGQVTYASIQSIYCRLGLYSKAEMVFSEMEKKGFDKCVVAYCTMVAMYGKTGRLKDAMRLVAKMKEKGCEPNVWIYNSLLDMHGKVLNLRQVEKTWKEMKRRKILPDRIGYTSVISAYSRAREFETCKRYYREFRLNGGKIDRAMAGIMVSVFSKMNHIDELVKLLQDMKTEGTKLDARLYRSAMNALRDTGLEVQAKWLQESFGAT